MVGLDSMEGKEGGMEGAGLALVVLKQETPQWDGPDNLPQHMHFGGQGVPKYTSSNPGHSPSVRRASLLKTLCGSLSFLYLLSQTPKSPPVLFYILQLHCSPEYPSFLLLVSSYHQLPILTKH
ncbi:hypothetical protein E2C01_002762 [Portunus trituberculatus]|uniref:Uncharacterized protein n=1 Tax=Portunus trituberculatus TaxID=210409 RepID=A0A5B7CKA9_PORTR|nr:hypothetical protein [Portunus trituberculatus]